MYLLHKPSNSLVEILNPSELWDPFLDKVTGQFHAGQELQDPESFTKAHLTFPSGEVLPHCWTDPNYRHIQFEAPTESVKISAKTAAESCYFAY